MEKKTNILNRGAHVGALMLLVILAAPAHAQVEPYPGIAPLFTDDAILEVMIDAPLTALMDVRPDKEHCDFAPIRLNFDKSQVGGTLFEGQDKLNSLRIARPTT